MGDDFSNFLGWGPQRSVFISGFRERGTESRYLRQQLILCLVFVIVKILGRHPVCKTAEGREGRVPHTAENATLGTTCSFNLPSRRQLLRLSVMGTKQQESQAGHLPACTHQLHLPLGKAGYLTFLHNSLGIRAKANKTKQNKTFF